MIYLVNNRELGTDDTAPTGALAVGLYRGDGLAIERFLPIWRIRPDRELPPYLARWRGHVVSRYPVAPALLALPMVALQIAYLDRFSPGWDRHPALFQEYTYGTFKLAAAMIAALVAVLLHRVLRGMGLRRVATPATLAAALGSDLWVVASQAPWQHGPAALALITAAWLLLPREPSRARLMLGGVAAAALVACRLIDIVFALAIFGWVARCQPRRLAWFLPGPVLGAAILIGSNVWIFGTITGGLAHLETVHPRTHAMPAGPWSGDLLAGAAGTLFSPNRGLFVFSPWVPLALATLPFSAARLAPWPLVRWLLWAIVPYGFLDLEVHGLVGRPLLRAAVLDRRHPPVRRHPGVRPRLVLRAVPAGRDGLRDGDRRLDRRAGDRRLLLSQLLEHEARQRRPPPRTALGLARHRVDPLPDRGAALVSIGQ